MKRGSPTDESPVGQTTRRILLILIPSGDMGISGVHDVNDYPCR